MIGSMARTKEGGSVATFVIVAIILTILLVGGVFIVQKTGPEKPKSPPGVTVQPSSPVTKSPSPKPSQKTSPSPAPTIRPPVTGTAPAQPLPKTGPSDSWMNIFMFAILVGMTTGYWQSRVYRLERFARQAVD